MREAFPEVLEFMRTRRSVPAKTMTGPGPSEGEVEAMIAIASRVPDHGKLAPWRFIRYSPDYCGKLNNICLARALERDPALPADLQAFEANRFTKVPVVIAIVSRAKPHPKIPEWEQLLSAGAASYGLLIAANAYGYDAQWLTEWVAYDEKLAPAFGVEPGEKLAGFVYVGTRTMPKTDRDRPSLGDVYSVMKG
jgi:nitroreductase